jgi:hypothetical protein
MMQEYVFPTTTNSDLDCIIRDGWFSGFSSVQQPSERIQSLAEISEDDRATPIREGLFRSMTERCKQIVRNGYKVAHLSKDYEYSELHINGLDCA